MPPAGITYRPKTHADRPFLSDLYASTRSEEMAMVPWTPEQKAEFLAMQFAAQWSHYEQYYPDADFLVVEAEGRPIGRIYIDRGPDEILLVDIALMPDQRGKGIGRQMMQELLDEAAAAGKNVVIHVERYNPALHLYQRLGFEPVGESGVYYEMRWSSSSRAAIS